MKTQDCDEEIHAAQDAPFLDTEGCPSQSSCQPFEEDVRLGVDGQWAACGPVERRSGPRDYDKTHHTAPRDHKSFTRPRRAKPSLLRLCRRRCCLCTVAVCLTIVLILRVCWHFTPPVEQNFIFIPQTDTLPRRPQNNHFFRSPSDVGMPFQNVTFQSLDGTVLNGWMILRPEPNSPTLVFMHGNAGNVGNYMSYFQKLNHEVGVNVFALEYRGYGDSEGHPTEQGIYEDGQAALQYVRTHPVVNASAIFSFGHSLGGAVAIDLAYRKQDQLAGLIVENTFTSVYEMAAFRHPNLARFGILGLLRVKMDSIAKIPKIHIPTLFISGTKDEVVPPYHMRELFEASGADFKAFGSIVGGGHYDTVMFRKTSKKVATFVRSVLG